MYEFSNVPCKNVLSNKTTLEVILNAEVEVPASGVAFI